MKKIAELGKRLSVVIAYKRYDEENHIIVRDSLNRFSIIMSRYRNVSILKMRKIYRKKR